MNEQYQPPIRYHFRQVSGVIAAGAVVVNLLLPTLFAFLFIGTLREHNNAATTSAVSWSSISRLLHSSYWPALLGSDSAALNGVPFRVLFFQYAGILSTMLVSLAAVVTPLGLSIPQETVDLFSSGLSATSNSISSIFDIQWRTWSWTRLSANSDSNVSLPIHHSYNKRYPIRVLTTYGSTWSEDILFIQPVLSCIDTNLTLDYRIRRKVGGFSQLSPTYPVWDIAHVQTNPQLWDRAYQAAWLSNVFGMSKFNAGNVTVGSDPYQPLILRGKDSVPGRVFPIEDGNDMGCYFECDNPGTITSNRSGCYAKTYNSGLPEHGSLEAGALMIKSLCEAHEFESSRGNMGNIATYCGLILGAAQKADGVEDDNLPFPSPGTAWSRPMYSRAMAAEAIIKTVIFSFNKTNDLSGLSILDITDKNYPSEAEKPLWGVENLLDTKFSHEAAANFSPDELQTVQKSSLFLPWSPSLFVWETSQNLPGVELHEIGLRFIDEVSSVPLSRTDYTGARNLAMARRWITLSKSAESMATALNLFWTDYAANAVVGTKGSPGPSSNTVLRPVATYRHAVLYDLAYAVPAAVVLAVLVIVSFLTLVALLLGRATLAKMKRYLNVTSSGRLMLSVLNWPLAVQSASNDTPTDDWLQSNGRINITAGKHMPVPVSGIEYSENSTLLKGPVGVQE
ncbi:hypothetical protein BJX61DRAFT_532594 [Aspergillus egyptiacus]|nr:hypothetical protein BJX61DRAFT_532594 [Aspergillus egyptiacus]